MSTKYSKIKDKVCPKCKNSNDELIEESFSHLDDFFLFEYYCEKCGCFWSRVFSYIGIYIHKKDRFEEIK